MEGNQTSLIESSDSDIKKLMASAVPENTKKSPKYAVPIPHSPFLVLGTSDVGIYEPKAPSFRVFDPRGVTKN